MREDDWSLLDVEFPLEDKTCQNSSYQASISRKKKES